MNRILCISLAILALATTAAADADLTKWPSKASIDVPAMSDNGLVETALTPELLAAARPDLFDLLLLNPAGKITPYVIRLNRAPAPQSVFYRPQRLYNPVFEPHRFSSVTVDFGDRAARTRVDVDTAGTNFRRRAMVEASSDDTTWQTLVKTAWLFRIAYPTGAYDKREIELPDNDFRYLRITVFNAPDDPERIEVSDVTAQRIQSATAELVDAPVANMTVTQDPKAKTTDIEIDLGYKNLPVAEIMPSFDGGNFFRRVEIFSRNENTRTIIEPVENAQPRKTVINVPWQVIAIGSVYRLPGGGTFDLSENTALRADTSARYLRLRIHNADAPPLTVTGVSIRRHQEFLDFVPDIPGQYTLYAGNLAASRPVYDLPQFVERLRAKGITRATVGPVTPNPVYAALQKTIPWSERYAWTLWVAFAIVAAAVAWAIVRQARSTRAAGS